MLEVQNYLKSGKSPEDLSRELGITSNIHPEDGRIILNYSITSPKLNTKVRECRGLILDRYYNLVGRSFFRFLNYGESKEDDKKFNWENKVVSLDKEDGSLIIVYFWKDSWRINTRNSWGDGEINDSGKTWKELVLSKLDLSKLDNSFTYTFELCSVYNKIVRRYPETKLYLLTMFLGDVELDFETLKLESELIGIPLPNYHEFTNISQVISYIEKVSENDPTFEGIVCRDYYNNRIKLKSIKYLQLHRLSNNGNVASLKNIVPLIMAGEKDELLTYFPELKECVLDAEKEIEKAWKEVDNTWFCYGEEDNKKKFALAIQKSTKYTAPLFSAWDSDSEPKKFWSSDYVLKNVFGVK